MATSDENPLKPSFDLYKTMDEDLAIAHGNAQHEGRTVDDGWEQLPARVTAAETDLGQLKAASGSRKKNRAEARHIRAVDEALGETYGALVERADAQANYLTVEAGVKTAMDAGGSRDMAALDRARARLQNASQNLATMRMVLLTDLENLAADLGLWEN
jgi:hypothetical protein